MASIFTGLAMIKCQNVSVSGPVLLMGGVDSAMASVWLFLAPDKFVSGDKESLTINYEL